MTFFQMQAQAPDYSPQLGHAQPNAQLGPQYLLQLDQCAIRLLVQCFAQTCLGGNTGPARRTMPLLDSFDPPVLTMLARYLLHPASAYTKLRGQRPHRASAGNMRFQHLPSQIVAVGARHLHPQTRQSCLILT